ncbi:FAD:protein FMN transferase [Donghicola sp. C2-DW-16]|uniref:FAD:protein FMN transferase n=1 Tax=Donghicola mangrovi TaxID=2729614 RepID=A0ABX2PF04_9RHOB|nr:FAD:protein FMN transferase [Donghicola mangrovi]NVO27501.1 FAD:protein FMN transferase [Donghicola mangrovi]
MSKMSFDGLTRFALNGATMGTRWSTLFWAPAPVDGLQEALQAAVDRVDAQMSLWKPDSDLCRLNDAPTDVWVDLAPEITTVLDRALQIGRASGGAFEIAVGEAVAAWGFGPRPADQEAIRRMLTTPDHPRATDLLELDIPNRRAMKHAPARFDLNGIAKGYGADRLIETAALHGVADALSGLDGDLRAAGTRPDGSPWPIAIEEPDYDRRAAYTMLELEDLAVATSGDYRHWIKVGGQRLSHTMHPRTGGPLQQSPASVTVVAADCMTADAWATALMVLGKTEGTLLAKANNIQAMFLEREAPIPA